MSKFSTSKALVLGFLNLLPCSLYSTDVKSEFDFTQIASMKRHYRNFTINGQVYNMPDDLSGMITIVEGPLINITSDATTVPYSYTISDITEDGSANSVTVDKKLLFRTHFPVPEDLQRISFHFLEDEKDVFPGIKSLICYTGVYCGNEDRNNLYATFHQSGEQLNLQHNRPRNIRFSAVIREKNGDTVTKLPMNRIDSFKILAITSGPFHDYTPRPAIVDQRVLRSDRIDLGKIPYDGQIITCDYSLKISGKEQEEKVRYTLEIKDSLLNAYKLIIFLKPDNTIRTMALKRSHK